VREGGIERGQREEERINRLIFCIFFKKKRKRENKQTYLMCFKERKECERGGRG
jgi:hypothetical protein